MTTNVIKCENELINDLTLRAWWVVRNMSINKCNASLNSISTGDITTVKCPIGIKKVIYKDVNKRLGHIKFVCDNGEISKQSGQATGAQAYHVKDVEFECPPNEYLHSIKGRSDEEGIQNDSLEFTCKPDPNAISSPISSPPTSAPLTSAPINEDAEYIPNNIVKNTTTPTKEEPAKSNTKLYFTIALIVLIILVIGFIIYKKRSSSSVT